MRVVTAGAVYRRGVRKIQAHPVRPIEFALDFKGLHRRTPFAPPPMTLSPTQIRFAAWSALGCPRGVCWFWPLLAPVLSPFILGAVLAYALLPLVDRWSALGFAALGGCGFVGFVDGGLAVFGRGLDDRAGHHATNSSCCSEQIPNLLLESANAVLVPLAQGSGACRCKLTWPWCATGCHSLISGNETEWFERVPFVFHAHWR